MIQEKRNPNGKRQYETRIILRCDARQGMSMARKEKPIKSGNLLLDCRCVFEVIAYLFTVTLAKPDTAPPTFTSNAKAAELEDGLYS